MSETTPSVFVRGELVGERPAPIKTTGFVGFLRTRLFNSPTNILITIVSALLLWFIVVPALRFVLIDAVWTGKRPHRVSRQKRRRCGRRLLAVHSGENRSVHLRLLSGAGALAGQSGLPHGRDPAAAAADSPAPAKGLNAGLFFIALPVIAFFLLHGGGLRGLGVSWTAGLLSGFNDSIGDSGRKLAAAGGARR